MILYEFPAIKDIYVFLGLTKSEILLLWEDETRRVAPRLINNKYRFFGY